MKTNQLLNIRHYIDKCLALLETVSNNSLLEIISKESICEIKKLSDACGYYDSSMPRYYFFGEFNSGKSTLINTLTNKKYAPTDMFEMTGWVSKLWKSNNNYCKINYKNGTWSYIEPDTFANKCFKREYSEEYLKSIEIVDYGISDLELNYILVDTPGYGGLNRENEKKLIDLLYEADVVIFTVDVESIGSLKEAALIREFVQKGMPYLLVLTKIDLIDDKNELIDILNFINKEYTVDKNNIFPVSALEDSESIKRLHIYLSTLAQTYSSVKRQEAEYAFLRLIASKLCEILGSYLSKLNKIESEISTFNTHVDSIADLISKSLMVDIEDYAKKTFLENRKNEIVSDIALSLDQAEGKVSNETIHHLFVKHLGENHISDLIDRLSVEIHSRIHEKWSCYMEDIREKSLKIFESLALSAHQNNSLSVRGNYDIQIDEITSQTFSRGVKGSVAVAGAITAYAAWLGPAASAVTLPMALTGVGIPIAIVGIAVSGLLAYKKRNQTKDAIIIYASDIVENVVSKIVQEGLMPNISKFVISQNNAYANFVKNNFYNNNRIGLSDNITVDTINELYQNLLMAAKKQM